MRARPSRVRRPSCRMGRGEQGREACINPTSPTTPCTTRTEVVPGAALVVPEVVVCPRTTIRTMGLPLLPQPEVVVRTTLLYTRTTIRTTRTTRTPTTRTTSHTSRRHPSAVPVPFSRRTRSTCRGQAASCRGGRRDWWRRRRVCRVSRR